MHGFYVCRRISGGGWRVPLAASIVRGQNLRVGEPASSSVVGDSSPPPEHHRSRSQDEQCHRNQAPLREDGDARGYLLAARVRAWHEWIPKPAERI
jgi:hypothetical protein